MSGTDNPNSSRFDDILEGVDIIGTLIDRELPKLAGQLQQITERLDGLSGQLEYADEAEAGESLLGDMRLRLELLEQRFLNFERASEEHFGDLQEKLESLSATLSEIQEELAAIREKDPPRQPT
ncbi:MAG: hypothetical protein ABIJ61_10900 [bacterium]